MTEDRWQHVKALFLAAVAVPPGERDGLLRGRCAGDEELLREVSGLLASHRDDEGAGDDDATRAAPTATALAGKAAARLHGLGRRVGPYTLLRVLGEGGMGVVYLAERLEPIRQTVALKLVRSGLETPGSLARFDAERRALALMKHPNVASVFDAGVDEDGRPYFVMEYVPGEPITAFCDAQRLGVRPRLALFADACDAVTHAHQKAVVHRDLKPSNILVTLLDGERPVVKVIDFGVAKAIRPAAAASLTRMTAEGQWVGTPEYMSPEQAGGGEAAGDVDTRTDVYSLGMVLYELLTGALPLDPAALRRMPPEVAQRMIRESDPPRPSVRLSGRDAVEAATRRASSPRTLTSTLRHELERVPLKAIRKDPAERYASVAAMADDVRNYLAGRPLEAGPESGWYRARKFLRRNSGPVVATGLVAAAVFAGAVASTVLAVRLTHAVDALTAEKAQTAAALTESQRQKDAAERARAEAEAVNRFITDDIIGSARPAVQRGRKLTVEEAFENAGERLEGKFEHAPLVEAGVRHALAGTLQAFGRPEAAERHARAAVDLRRRNFGPNDPRTLDSMFSLSVALRAQGKTQDAVPVLSDTLERQRHVLGTDHPATLLSMGHVGLLYQQRGLLPEAEPFLRGALEGKRRVLGVDHVGTQASINNLGVLLQARGRLSEAEPLLLQSLEGLRRLLGEDHPETLSAVNNLGELREAQGDSREAERSYVEALWRMREVLGAQHPNTLIVTENLRRLLQATGKPSGTPVTTRPSDQHD